MTFFEEIGIVEESYADMTQSFDHYSDQMESLTASIEREQSLTKIVAV